MTDWRFRRNARQILHKVHTGEMHVNDALVRLQMLHEDADMGQRYDSEQHSA